MRESARGILKAHAEPLVTVTRGSLVESLHRGHVAAVTGDGRLVAYSGDPETVTFLRSACKPQQAVPLVASGAASAFRFTDEELAVACASHNGEPVHTGAVLSVLGKIGLRVEDLKCGAHEPYSGEAAKRLRERGEEPTALHNNCSGKHAAMLALALHLRDPAETYRLPESRVQQRVARSVSLFSGVAVEEITIATDGCGLPTYGVSVRAMALMQARLVAPPAEWDSETRDACRRIVSAMTEHPALVEGEDELDTELMRRATGRLISKVGAEGVYTAGVLPCEQWPEGLGLAFKIEDGDKGDRARPVAAVEALRRLGVLSEDDCAALEPLTQKVLKNRRGEEVGEVRASFELRKGDG